MKMAREYDGRIAVLLLVAAILAFTVYVTPNLQVMIWYLTQQETP